MLKLITHDYVTCLIFSHSYTLLPPPPPFWFVHSSYGEWSVFYIQLFLLGSILVAARLRGSFTSISDSAHRPNIAGLSSILPGPSHEPKRHQKAIVIHFDLNNTLQMGCEKNICHLSPNFFAAQSARSVGLGGNVAKSLVLWAAASVA